MPKRRPSSSETGGVSPIVTTERSSAPDKESGMVRSEEVLFVLDSDRHDAFWHALDNPPAPGAKLRSLLCRVPKWRI
jgi:uncharacterized protein DUF1778